MRICDYHKNEINRKLRSRGLQDPEHKAESIILGVASEENPDLLDLPHCPICRNITKNYIGRAVAALEASNAK